MSIDLPMGSEGKGVFECTGRIGKNKNLIRKEMRNMKNMKRNNKGFSLVELIIVIAIMAVLIGVLAPAYLKYVEKSRKSADIQAIDSIMNAIEATAIDPEYDLVANDTIEITFTDGAIDAKVGEDNTTARTVLAANDVKDIVGTYTFKSSDWNPVIKSVAGTITADGHIQFTIDAGAKSNEIITAGDFPTNTVKAK